MFITKKQKDKYTDEIAKLRHEIADLTNIVKTQELIRLRAENAKLREKEQLIGKIRIKLKSVAYLDLEGKILVKYEIPPVTVPVDEEGNVLKNDFFYAINKLQLLSFEDMKKISAVVDNIKGPEQKQK